MSNVTVQEALKVAESILKTYHGKHLKVPEGECWMDFSKSIEIIDAALSEIDKCESETSSQPVAYMNDSGFAYAEFKEDLDEYYGKPIPLYITPQPREWAGLSDEVKQKLHKEHHLYIPTIELIESACKQLNTKG